MKKAIIITSVAIAALGLGTFGAYKAIDSIIGAKVEATPPMPKGQTKNVGAPAPAKPDENTMNIPVDKYRAAVEEYMSSPLPVYDEAGMSKIVETEFGGQQPKTLGELLVEVGRMFRDESPFTSSRAQAVAYLAQTEPIASEIKKLGKPFPSLVFDQDDDIHNASVHARDQFKAYVRAYLGLAPKPEPKINLSTEEYNSMMKIIRDVDAGKLPDSDLVKAEKLIRRSLQDLNDPEGNYSAKHVKPEERDRILAKWQDLADRMEASRIAP